MADSFPDLRDRFRESMAQFLWDQWSLVGMSGHRHTSRAIGFAVDPEALLLATTRFGKFDTRLLTEALDWLLLNCGAIVSQRVRNLQAGFRYACLPTLAGIDKILSESRPRDWRSLRSLADDQTGEPPDTALAFEASSRRGGSVRPAPGRPETLLFTLRSVFGCSARVEVIAWLLARETGYPAEIARETGWNSKSVQQILNDLELSGLITAQRHDREKQFRMDRLHWLKWLHPFENHERPGTPVWINQSAFYAGCHYVEKILDRLVELPDAEESLQSIVIRETAFERVSKEVPSLRTTFELSGFGFLFSYLTEARGGSLTGLFESGVERLIELLANFSLSSEAGSLRQALP